MLKQYVVIGGGAAAVGCIDGIRAADKQSGITLICGEKRPAYYRPLISYFLEGRTEPERMKYRPDEFYENNGCTLVYARAVSVDSSQHTVTLDDGRTISYDELCIAAGSSPFVPPFAGLDTVKAKFGFMTLDDAIALNAAAKPDSRVLIMGAGLIGLKCAEGLCGHVKELTVCDLAPRVLSSILDEPCAALMQNVLEERGVKFLLGDSAERFEENTAYMKSGASVSFDILVLAVGVRANIGLVKDAGGECDRGVLVDKRMRTSLENVYAAGDCAQGLDASTGEKRVIAILPNAYIQGRCAGVNMAGENEEFDKAIPMNAIGFFGLHALTAGNCSGEMYEEKTDSGVKRLFVKDGLLKGFILIGNVAGAGIYTALIRERTPLASLDFEALKTAPSLAPFSAEMRNKMLSEVQ